MRLTKSLAAAILMAALATPTFATDPVPGVDINLGQDLGLRQSENSPVRLDWEPQGTNYNSSRSNRGKRPSIAAGVNGAIVGAEGRFFEATLEATESEEGARTFTAFEIPAACGDACQFSIRVVRLDRALEELALQLEVSVLPAGTEMVVTVSVGDRTFESVVPAFQLFTDDTYRTTNRFVLGGFDGREGMRGTVEVAFFLPEAREDPAAGGRGD